MRLLPPTLLVAAGLALRARAKTIKINVGKNDTLKFEPNTITAEAGDVLEFHFWPGDHSVAAGDWTNACFPADDGGFYSGFHFATSSGESDNSYRVTVNNTDPIALYCTRSVHCQGGMVAVVNPGGDQTLRNYADAAEKVSQSESPPEEFGGLLVRKDGSTVRQTGSPPGPGRGGGGGGSDGDGSGAGSGAGAIRMSSLGGLVGALAVAALLV